MTDRHGMAVYDGRGGTKLAPGADAKPRRPPAPAETPAAWLETRIDEAAEAKAEVDRLTAKVVHLLGVLRVTERARDAALTKLAASRPRRWWRR